MGSTNINAEDETLSFDRLHAMLFVTQTDRFLCNIRGSVNNNNYSMAERYKLQTIRTATFSVILLFVSFL